MTCSLPTWCSHFWVRKQDDSTASMFYVGQPHYLKIVRAYNVWYQEHISSFIMHSWLYKETATFDTCLDPPDPRLPQIQDLSLHSPWEQCHNQEISGMTWIPDALIYHCDPCQNACNNVVICEPYCMHDYAVESYSLEASRELLQLFFRHSYCVSVTT